MPPQERDRYSCIRAAREAEPTIELKQFLGRVAKHCADMLEPDDSTLVITQASLDEQLTAGYEPTVEQIYLPAANVYKANHIWATLFERRRSRSPRENKALQRLCNRLMEVELMPEDDEASRAGATAEAGYFIETTRPGIGKGLREFGVVLNESPLTNSLRSRHEALYAEAQRKVGSTKTQSIQPETILDPTVIPIFTIPARTDDKVVIELIERLDGDAQFGSLATLTFKGPEWVLIFPVA